MSVFFHWKDAKMANYSAMYLFSKLALPNSCHLNFSSCTFHLPHYLLCCWRETSLSIYTVRQDRYVTIIHQCYCDGINRRLNMIIIHSKYFPDSDWLKAHV